MPRQPPAIFLMGPTASGKTGLAVALAGCLPLEIVSVDSALVYRGMDIGTAKPDAATLARAPHHLINILDPVESYSAARFREDALEQMRAITERGNVPLLVGGTMLYFNALQHGMNVMPEGDAALRARIVARAAQLGWPALHAELAVVDPETAARLQPKDAQRIERALEIFQSTGRPMADWLKARTAEALPYTLLKIALIPSDRATLHQRIAARFETMLAAGLVDELRALRAAWPDLSPAMPSMRCVGYRQAWQYDAGAFDLATLWDKGVAATRQLAKRQLTWLRGMNDTQPVDCLAANLLEQVKTLVRPVIP